MSEVPLYHGKSSEKVSDSCGGRGVLERGQRAVRDTCTVNFNRINFSHRVAFCREVGSSQHIPRLSPLNPPPPVGHIRGSPAHKKPPPTRTLQ